MVFDSSAGEKAPRRSRAERWALPILVTGCSLSLLLLVHPWYDETTDGSIYIATARSLAAGEGYSYLGAPFAARPPGWSFLIAPFIARGEVPFGLLNAFVALFGVAAVALLFVFQRPRIGGLAAFLVALAVWLNPGMQLLCNQVMSDVPAMALLFASLILERWASRTPSWGRELVLGLSIGLSGYVRTANMFVVPGIVAARLLRRIRLTRSDERPTSWPAFGWSRIGIFAGTAWLVILPWAIREAPPSPADHSRVHTSSTAMWRADSGDAASRKLGLGEILGRAIEHAPEFTSALGSRVQTENPSSSAIAWTILLIACSLVVIAKRTDPAELYAIVLIIVLLLFPSKILLRYMLPLYAILLPATVEVLRDGLHHLVGARFTSFALPLALLALIVLDFHPRLNWDAIEQEHESFAELCRDIESNLPADSRLGAVVGARYSVYMNRPVYSLYYAAFRAKRIHAIEEVIDRYDLNTVVLMPEKRRDANILRYLRTRYGDCRIIGKACIVRVRP